MKWTRLLLSSLLVLPSLVHADAPASMRPTHYVLDDRRDYGAHPLGTPLFVPDQGFDYGPQLYGMYGGLDDDINEYYLYIFPNGKYIIKDDCHCATPPFILAMGSWHRDGGILTFTQEKKATSSCGSSSLKEMNIRFGSLDKVDVMLTASGSNPGRFLLVPEATLMLAAMDRLFVRERQFRGWQKEYSALSNQLSAGPDGCDCDNP